jgi:NAD(P)-dependent dehydrogenase (short-subunit alcohol dehydrogenase family)
MTSAFAGKVAMVTGARGNLGRAVVEAFVDAGARVATVDRATGAGDAPKVVDDRRFAVYADLLNADSTRTAADAAFAHFGRIDILCNIAGGFTMGAPVHETSDAVFRRMFDLNVMSVVHMAQAVVPRMISAGRGCIVSVAAASAQRGQANMAAYSAAKSAVIRLTESMAAELRPHGIGVACILPTIIDTPENRAAMPDADTRTWMPPAVVAREMLELAANALTPHTRPT